MSGVGDTDERYISETAAEYPGHVSEEEAHFSGDEDRHESYSFSEGILI
jgi:hypothetical protein